MRVPRVSRPTLQKRGKLAPGGGVVVQLQQAVGLGNEPGERSPRQRRNGPSRWRGGAIDTASQLNGNLPVR
jgi:hypothetical protein